MSKVKVTVDEFMEMLDHPLKDEIQAVRDIILNVNNGIYEEIKWAAPTFSYKGYILTIHVRSKEYVHLIFHNGAILHDKSGLLEGEYVDRRMVKLLSMADVKSRKTDLENAVKEWIRLMDR